jgi:hypothetical protein
MSAHEPLSPRAGERRRTQLRIDPAHGRFLHELADVLSSTLETPIVITDVGLALIAASEHTSVEAETPAPTFSPEALSLSVRALGQLTSPAHVPAVSEIGLAGFWVAPIAVDGRTVALLWIVEHDRPVRTAQVLHAERTAKATLRAVVRSGALADAPDGEGDRSSALMADEAPAVAAAVAARASGGAFVHESTTFAVSVATLPLNDHFATRAELARVLGATVERASASYPPARRIVAQRGTESVVLIAPFPGDDVSAAAEQILEATQDLMTRSEQRELYGAWTVGVSERGEDLATSGETVLQARQAAQLGLRVGWSRRSVAWSEVGHYRGISSLPAGYLHAHFLSADLERFLSTPENAELVDTLERFLFHAGNIQAVASESFLHRTTVYHRLRRAEALLDIDLGRGHDRLELHMGLLSWRLLHRSISRTSLSPRPLAG